MEPMATIDACIALLAGSTSPRECYQAAGINYAWWPAESTPSAAWETQRDGIAMAAAVHAMAARGAIDRGPIVAAIVAVAEAAVVVLDAPTAAKARQALSVARGGIESPLGWADAEHAWEWLGGARARLPSTATAASHAAFFVLNAVHAALHAARSRDAWPLPIGGAARDCAMALAVAREAHPAWSAEPTPAALAAAADVLQRALPWSVIGPAVARSVGQTAGATYRHGVDGRAGLVARASGLPCVAPASAHDAAAWARGWRAPGRVLAAA